ncbi:MAG TPA: hypothetical protein VHH11_19505 [Gammaproteobacteria bacterium]|jgi:hypothetical protein|nr:hypothetical protein [Gammaproteobacteria bacterium]
MKIQWLRVLLGGFLIEVVLAVVLIGGFAVVGIDISRGVSAGIAIVIGAGCFLAAFVVVLWLGRGVAGQVVLHGLLMGLIATLLYLALVAGSGQWSSALAGYGTVTFVTVNGLRLLGGLFGGVLCQRQRAVPA